MSVKLSDSDGGVLFWVRVTPRAYRSEITGEHDGALKVRIAAPPVDGAANAELIKLLAKRLGVAKSDVEIVAGETSKHKRVKIFNITRSEFEDTREMKSQISFTTDIFESRDAKPNFTNPRNFGEDLAAWLVEVSRGSEFKLGAPLQTAEGWTVPAESGGEHFEIGIGIMNESIGDAQANWLITIEKTRKWGILGSKDSALRSELCDHIQNVLRDKPHIREIRWTDQVGHFAP